MNITRLCVILCEIVLKNTAFYRKSKALRDRWGFAAVLGIIIETKGACVMEKFCRKCGAEIDQTTGLCPNCDGQPPVQDGAADQPVRKEQVPQKKALTKEEKKAAWADAKKRYKADIAKKKKDRTSKQKRARVLLKLMFVLLLLAAFVFGGYYALSNLGLLPAKTRTPSSSGPSKKEEPTENGSIGIYNPPTGDMPEEYEPPMVDADEYFGDNSQVVQIIPAGSAGRTEAQAYKNLTDRGFTEQPITTEYSMTGDYSDAKEISKSGMAKHPMYTTYFVAENGDIWVVYEINGKVFADPISFNFNSGSSARVVLSESDTLTSYDGASNQFYVTKPYSSVMRIKVVGKINADTLNTLSREVWRLYE